MAPMASRTCNPTTRVRTYTISDTSQCAGTVGSAPSRPPAALCASCLGPNAPRARAMRRTRQYPAEVTRLALHGEHRPLNVMGSHAGPAGSLCPLEPISLHFFFANCGLPILACLEYFFFSTKLITPPCQKVFIGNFNFYHHEHRLLAELPHHRHLQVKLSLFCQMGPFILPRKN